MTERKYSVTELDDLRRACNNKYIWGRYGNTGRGGLSRTYLEVEKTKCVEEMVRTHMIAGHTAKDLYDSELERK